MTTDSQDVAKLSRWIHMNVATCQEHSHVFLKHRSIKFPNLHTNTLWLNKEILGDNIPLMAGAKETDIIFGSLYLYHFGWPVAEAFLLGKY